MDGDELGAVRKCPLDLDLRDHVGHALHDRVGRQNGRAKAHDLGDRAPVANHLENFGRDERDRLRVVQLEAARPPLSRQLAG